MLPVSRYTPLVDNHRTRAESDMTTLMYADRLFAPVDADLRMQRIAGGNETEVYCTDDRRHVVKVKSADTSGSTEEALSQARLLRAAAHAFTKALGPRYTIPNYFFVTRDSAGQAKPVVVQPYVCNARPLCEADYSALSPEEREQIAVQLREIIRRSLDFYRRTGCMPDLYGRLSRNSAERRRSNSLLRLPERMWSFLVQRTLLRSHNLLLSGSPERRLLLVDYDPVQKGWLYRTLYYAARVVLFLRDWVLIRRMENGVPSP